MARFIVIDDHTVITAAQAEPAAQCDHPGGKRPLVDARGIFCCYVCDRCEGTRRKHFRAEIFTDPSYEADEPIEED
ncbi:MAG TPA: hypothetical protein VL614_15190 [Acetobacteraceae bacterium]|jgi:hypothetical protein|nr:hypothetical protein [Acetobacteraceae bacterium]